MKRIAFALVTSIFLALTVASCTGGSTSNRQGTWLDARRGEVLDLSGAVVQSVNSKC